MLRSRHHLWPTLLLLSSILLPVCFSAIYEDQIDEFDWQRRQVGAITAVVTFPNPHAASASTAVSQSLVVATSSGVLAKLNVMTGDILWRHVLFPLAAPFSSASSAMSTSSTSRASHLCAIDTSLFSYTPLLQRLSRWSATSGSLAWSTHVPSTDRPTGPSGLASYLTPLVHRHAVVVTTPFEVTLVSVEGQVLWSTSLFESSSSSVVTSWSTQTLATDTYLVVTVTRRSSSTQEALTKIWILELATGTVTRQSTELASTEATGTSTLILHQLVDASVFLIRQNDKTQALSVQSLLPLVDATPVQVLVIPSWAQSSASSLSSSSSVLSAASQNLSHFFFMDDILCQLVLSSQGLYTLTRGEEFLSTETDTGLFSHPPRVAGHRLSLLHVSFNRLTRWTLDSTRTVTSEISSGALEQVTADHGDIVSAFSIPSSSKLLLIMADHAAVMIRARPRSDQGSVDRPDVDVTLVWEREEALASIVATGWITPFLGRHVSTTKASSASIPSWTEALGLQWSEVTSLLTSIVLPSSMPDASESVASSQASFFGLTKVLVVLTAPGKVYGLASETGTILWGHWLPGSTSCHAQDEVTMQAFDKVFQDSASISPVRATLIVTRDHAGLAASARPQVVLVAQVPSQGLYFWTLDATTGHLIDTTCVPSVSLAWLTPMQSRLAYVTRPALASVPVSFYPSLSMNTTHDPAPCPFQDHSPSPSKPLFVSAFDTGPMSKTLSRSTTLTGHQLLSSSVNTTTSSLSSSSSSGCEVHAVETWRMHWEEPVVATARPTVTATIASPVLITGDDSLLIKYINGHLLAVATLSETKAAENPLTCAVLTLVLIDTVSGRVLHRLNHDCAALPVHLVMEEHWLVYSFWNTKDVSTQIGSLALFQGAISSHGLNPFAGPPAQSEASLSSFTAPLPIVLSKLFYFPHSIQALGVTVTAHGITPRHLLVGLSSGQLYSLAMKFLDPRRPDTKPTAVEMSEGLMPYRAMLTLNPLLMASANRSVAALDTITSTVSSLESTTLVFASGLDLYYSRVTPAGTFDLLPSDFAKPLLATLVTGLAGLAALARHFSARKKITDSWQ